MKAKISALIRPAPAQAPWFREGAGYLLAVIVVGTELIARITFVILH
jgi:hypothetical protein